MTLRRPNCAIDGCDSPVQARGWCNRHYLRWWRHGDPNTQHRAWNQQSDSCTIPGCDKPPVARGWCVTHYGRWERNGLWGPNTRSCRLTM